MSFLFNNKNSVLFIIIHFGVPSTFCKVYLLHQLVKTMTKYYSVCCPILLLHFLLQNSALIFLLCLHVKMKHIAGSKAHNYSNVKVQNWRRKKHILFMIYYNFMIWVIISEFILHDCVQIGRSMTKTQFFPQIIPRLNQIIYEFVKDLLLLSTIDLFP